jgi:deoxyadenosine/deoxycytidine kinase
LSSDLPHWCESRWTLSDFWLDQSAAFARAWLSQDDAASYVEQYERLLGEAVRPRLVVLLDVPADELYMRIQRRGRQCERRLTQEQLERIGREIHVQTELPDVGPVLRASGDAESTFAEVMAAIQAME